MKHLVTLFSVFFISTFIMAQGQVINVPDDQPTIQEAIDASSNGDTVLVADGTYYENINYRGKAVTVASWFLIDGDETHIDSTIINGSQPSHPDSGSVVFIENSQDSNSVLYGFTITGGTGTKTEFGELGGGVAIGFSGAKIEYNKIINNSTVHNGGGITIGYPQHPIIIRKNYIANNIAEDLNNTNGGGGMMIAYDYEAFVLVAENVIVNNLVYSFVGSGVGGGISLQHSNSVIRNNIIAKNIAAEGAGIHMHDGTNPNKPAIVNNTIAHNTATDEGGGIHAGFDNPLEGPIRNCIVMGNTAPTGSQIFNVSGGYAVLFEYSNIEGGFEGNGNIDIDPLFADTTNYYLTSLSPCVDAGSPYAFYNDIEDPDNPGYPLFPAMGGLRNDMGAYGGNPGMLNAPVLEGYVHVPGDYSTIQAAINASVDGDTVLVADGTYYENINFRGKAITVASWFLIDEDETHVDNTIIDGSQSTKPDTGSVVYFGLGEDTTSVLCGFTITGGTGSKPPGAPHNAWGAGGIAIDAGAKIIYNKIVFNTVTSPHEYAYGGGILISPTKPVQIINNLISNNKVIGTSAQHGGGAGIFCAFVNNTALIIADNIITNNSVVTTLGVTKGSGGAFYYTHSSANPNIRNNLIKNNVARLGGGLKFNADGDKATLINNTIVNNHAADRGGAIYSADPITVINSIFWGNTALANSQIFSHVQGNVIVEYSNVEGGFEGNGNIDQDPLFADTTNYYLTSLSPCVDAGNPNSENDLEDQNNSGFALYPALGSLRNDMGYCGGKGDLPVAVDDEDSNQPTGFALEQNYPNPFNPTTTIKYSLPRRSEAKTGIPAQSLQSSVGIMQNPASSIQPVPAKWNEAGHQVSVSLKVYDVIGREVATLVNEHQLPGSYTVQFDASGLSSGVYFYKLTADRHISTKKLMILK